ncbi:MAG: glycosyltransferase family 39 protein [Phycisphaerae bacterium]|nr:glycosyltransferase family 39 protein [Phycisphaerae bacterium]
MSELDRIAPGLYNDSPRQTDGGRTIEPRNARRKTVIAAMAAVFALGLAVRIHLIHTTELVSRDGITFVKYARGLQADPLTTMRDQDQHPLYPASILIVYSAVGQWLAPDPVDAWPLAGQIASLLGSMLAIWAAFALGWIMWDQRVGVITALFMAMLPELCQVGADALSDGLHLGLYLWGLVAVLRGLHRNDMRWLAAAAVLSGLAFLIRPEGGSILVVGLFTMVIARQAQGWTRRRRIIGTAVLLICFFAVAGPYMAAVGRLVQKKSLIELFGLGAADQSAMLRKPADPAPVDAMIARAETKLPIAIDLIYHWARSCRLIYLLLALPALTARIVPRPRGIGPVFFAAGLHLCLLYALSASFGYVSLRHLLVLVALTMPFAAATFVWIVDQASIRIASRHNRRAKAVRRLVYLVGVILVVGPTTPYMFRVIGEDGAYLIKAGRWLRDHSEPEQSVLTTRNRVAYYAERKMLAGPDTGQMKHWESYVRVLKPDYLVVDEAHETSEDRNPDFFANLHASTLGRRLILIHKEPGPKGSLWIYRVGPASAATKPSSRSKPSNR